MSHYFSENAALEDEEIQIPYRFHGRDFLFFSNSGVFSKNHIDLASDLLLETFHRDMEKLKAEDLATYRLLSSGEALDMGCGYGVLGIVGKRLYPGTTWTFADVNERALALTTKNLQENGVYGARVVKSQGFASLDQSYSLIISNPPIRIGKEALYSIFSEMKEHLVPGGRVYLVIGKKQGAKSAQDFLGTVFQNLEVLEKKKGFYILVCS